MTIKLFTPGNTAVVLIDHQAGTMDWVRSATFDDMNCAPWPWPGPPKRSACRSS